MLPILELIIKGGFRTSEFWVTMAGLLVTVISPFVPGWVASLHAQQQSAASPVQGLLLGFAAAVISGSYTIARTLLKGKVADSAATIESAPDAPPTPPPNAVAIHLPSGNVMTPGPGSAALEDAHRTAVVTATKALEAATAALAQASNLPRPSTFGPPAPTGATESTAVKDPAPVASSSAPLGSSSSSSGDSPGKQ